MKTLIFYAVCMALYFEFIINYPFIKIFFGFIDSYKYNINGIVLYVQLFGILFFLLFLFFYLLASSQIIIKLITIVLIILSCFASYGIFSFNVNFTTKETIESIFTANHVEAFGYYEINMILYITLMSIPAIFFVCSMIKPRYSSIKRILLYKISGLLICSCIILLLFCTNFLNGAFFVLDEFTPIRTRIIPFNYIYGIIRYVNSIHKEDISKDFLHIGDDAKFINLQKKIFVVLIVGESTRFKNFSLNGYIRNTNPKLQSRKDIFSFKQFYSCGALTKISVPCMFSNLGRDNFSFQKTLYRDNLLDIIQRTKYNVLWVDNNLDDYFVPSRIWNINVKNNCGKNCFDSNLLSELVRNEHLFDKSKNNFVILHQYGSHGPQYFERYPVEFKRFTPECRDVSLKNCSMQSLVNTYDNTIIFADNNINDTIEYLEKKKNYLTALIYVSDHGESLGEKGLYLHALPYSIAPDEQIHIPFIVWYSNEFKSFFKLEENCLTSIKNNYYTHDNIFHTILGILRITTKVYNPDLDIFNNCRKVI